MALYRRIFPHREKKCRWGFRSHKKDYNFSSPEVLTSYKSWQAPEFDQKQIRLLVFNECDVKGRKLLFDSKAIKKKGQKLEPSPCRGNQYRFGCRCRSKNDLSSDGIHQENSSSLGPNGDINNKYSFLRPSSDVKLLGEMMYGSVAMSYRGSTVKVHTIKSPSELMLSQVFVLRPKENLDQDSIDKDNISLVPVEMMVPRSTPNAPPKESIAHSLPVAVPPSSPYSSLDEDSGVVCMGSSSFLTPFPSPGSSVSSTQSNSFHRRWMRNQVTSMEHGVRRKSSETLLNVDEPINRRRHPKIGVGVVVSLFDETDLEKSRHFQTFFFSHFTLFEGHFHRMSLAVEKALTYQRRMFIPPIMDALDEFRSSVYSMYCAPRIQRPIWLNMMTYQMQRGHLCGHLIHELRTELGLHNNKQTNFFFSRLLTAVLMHHLAWVPTVMPAEATPSRAYLDKHSSTLLDMLAKSHPYNPLWAQLGDMFGAIGFPCKVSKTIIVGRRADVVCRLLYILSYFIRCSEVHEIPEHREKIYMEYEAALDLQALGIASGDETAVGTATMDSNGCALDAIPKTEGAPLPCDSADSGLESSGERFIDTGERKEDVPNMEVGKCAMDAVSRETLIGKLMTRTQVECSSSDDERRATKDQANSLIVRDETRNVESDENNVKNLCGHSVTLTGTFPTGSMCGSKVIGQEKTSLFDINTGTHERPVSGGLYPDLQSILLATSDGIGNDGGSGTTFVRPLQNDGRITAPFVQLRDVDMFPSPQRECVVPVGRSTPTESKDFQDETGGRPAIFPKIFNETLDSKREYAVSVGRTSLFEDSTRLKDDNLLYSKTNQDELITYESGPGHDRSPSTTLTGLPKAVNQSLDLLNVQTSPTHSQEPTKTQVPSPTVSNVRNAVPALFSLTDSDDATSNQDSASPSLRRQKRFPLTSPLARAHQEAMRLKESKIENSNPQELSTANSYANTQKDNKECCGTRGQQTTPHQVSGTADHAHPDTEVKPDAPVRHVSEWPLPILDNKCTDTRGQQTTLVRRQRSYQRCFSVGSSVSSGYSDMTLTDHEELPMAFSEPMTPETDPGESYVDNFGRSLLGGYSQSYVPDMALHGVPVLDRKQVLSDLVLASQNSVLDEAISEAVCIVADTDNWTVELLSSERAAPTPDKPMSLEISIAECIVDLLESVQQMCHLRMASDFCLMHLEDKLQELYFKSTVLAAYLNQKPRAGPKELSAILGFEPSDLPLLLSVTSVHSPNVIRSVLRETYEKR